MKYSISDFFIVLRKRMSEEDILKIAQVNREIFNKKINLENINDDQMAISVYYKLYSVISNEEVCTLNSFRGYKTTKS